MGAEPIIVDGLNALSASAAIGRTEPEVIMRPFDRWVTNQLRTKGAENLIAAAKASGAKRVVALS